METYAFFDNIHKHILKELNRAVFDVTAAIAWFTDKDIYDLLCKKAAQNVNIRVLLIKDHINTGQFGLNFEKLKSLGGKAFFIPDPRRSGVTMHHKFCVIDDKTVITGSYNWSKRARENYENITVIKDDSKFASQFREEFENILARNALTKKMGIRIDYAQILTRLDLIKNLIILGETKDINRHIENLRMLESDKKIQNIVLLLDCSDFDNALKKIEQCKNHRQAVTEYQDPDLSSLKLELKSFEIELNALRDEKLEIERQILNFNNLQNMIIGEVLTEHLRLRREKLRREWIRSENNDEKDQEQRKNEYKEAKGEYEEYKDDYEASKQQELLPDLTDEEQIELKKLYRRASSLCHPDKVAESDKERAHGIFVELQQAYQRNDLGALKKILQYLKEGRIFTYRAETVSEKDIIKREIKHLQRQIEKILEQINQLGATSAWQTITSIEDWNHYFDDQKNKLETEIELMKEELGIE